jgi:hypothetical protein
MFINLLLAVVFLLASVEALPEAISDPKLSGVALLRVREIGNSDFSFIKMKEIKHYIKILFKMSVGEEP